MTRSGKITRTESLCAKQKNLLNFSPPSSRSYSRKCLKHFYSIKQESTLQVSLSLYRKSDQRHLNLFLLVASQDSTSLTGHASICCSRQSNHIQMYYFFLNKKTLLKTMKQKAERSPGKTWLMCCIVGKYT